MAEHLSQHRGTERSPEAVIHRLPFIPIFDTIEAGTPPEPPLPQSEFGRLSLQKSDERKRNSLISPLPRPPESTLAYRRGISLWIIAVSIVAVALAVTYLGSQLRTQPSILSDQLMNSSQRLAHAEDEGRRLEQRAWVGVAETVPQPLTATGAAFNLAVQNSGKTPALDVHILGTLRLETSPSVAAPEEAPAAVQRSLGSLFPGGAYKDRLEFHIPLRSVAALYRNQTRAVVQISITYHDIFQGFHTTRSCFDWEPGSPVLQACEQENTVN